MDINSLKNKNMGGLIWITGYSGAGKTTIAQMVHAKLLELDMPVIFLDGDELRSILGEKFGHDLDSRKQLASVYGRLCKKIADSGITVVIATIAMFEVVRKENRISNNRYLEIYLDVPLSVRSERDPKGLYKASGNNASSLRLEEPENPDLIIQNHGTTSPDSAALMIVSKYQTIIEQEKELPLHENIYEVISDVAMDDRTKYWDAYYKNRGAPITPSSFALFCHENYLNSHCHILEFGCGNARDSFFLAKNHRITAIDESNVVVEANRVRALQDGMLSIEFLHGEYGTAIPGLPVQVDAIYARFVMHAMKEDAENRALKESWRLLNNHGKLLLEFRTSHDPLMTKGEHISESERKTDHYRRFIDFQKFCEKLTNIGFLIEYAIEKKGLATFKNDDPVVGRIVATKILND